MIQTGMGSGDKKHQQQLKQTKNYKKIFKGDLSQKDMTIYGTKEQHKQMPGIYRDSANLVEDILGNAPLSLQRPKEIEPPQKTRDNLAGKILLDRLGL